MEAKLDPRERAWQLASNLDNLASALTPPPDKAMPYDVRWAELARAAAVAKLAKQLEQIAYNIPK